MRDWSLSVNVAERSGVPLYRRIARAIVIDIQRGRLRPGAPLPGTRTLAAQLGIHRNTVTAAYADVIEQGWATTSPSRGLFVNDTLPLRATVLPELVPARAPFGRGIARSRATGTLAFTDGTADPRLAPMIELSRALRRALLGRQHASASGYEDPRGHERLRVAVAEMLSRRRDIAASAGRIVITRGSQMAIYLLARASVAPGDVVAVEAPGYRPAWSAFRAAGASLLGVPIDDEGLRVEDLRRLARGKRVRAVYVTPQHQYPTTATLSSRRRLELLQWADETGAVVIEDDYDHEFQFEGSPILPLASIQRSSVKVAYVGTFSKLLAPGIRVGFVHCGEQMAGALAELRSVIDRQGDGALERAIAELMEDGDLQRHVRKVAREYVRRRDRLIAALTATFADRLGFKVPAGGLALWVTTPPSVDTDAWSERARARGLEISPGRQFTLDDRCPRALRLGFASLTTGEIARAVELLAATMPLRPA